MSELAVRFDNVEVSVEIGGDLGVELLNLLGFDLGKLVGAG